MNKVLEYAKVVGQCQRNWDYSQPMPQEHIDYILNTAEAMPTKQSLPVYEIFASTNLEFNAEIFRLARAKNQPHTIKRNAQVNAPLLLMFVDNRHPRLHMVEDQYFAVGLAAGGAGIAAQELGYKTGFCKCYENLEILEALNKIGYVCTEGKNIKRNVLLMLGIGTPKEGVERGEVFENDFFLRHIKPDGPKKISKFIYT